MSDRSAECSLAISCRTHNVFYACHYKPYTSLKVPIWVKTGKHLTLELKVMLFQERRGEKRKKTVLL